LPIPWNHDDPRDQTRIVENLVEVLRDIVSTAPERGPAKVEMACAWHRSVHEEVRIPVAAYAGGLRGGAHPELETYEVKVGAASGAPAHTVATELSRFESLMQRAVAKLDAVIPVGEPPADHGALHSVLALCAHAHGEWVRIHPFANGNGRIARLWANWCALRYGLPPFVRLRPRPEGRGYAAMAAAESMLGRHRPMVGEFADMLAERLRQGP
jgi:Fic family protein